MSEAIVSSIPTDDTPFLPPVPNINTRIIWDRWIDTNGTALAPPTIETVGGPFRVPTYKTTVWAAAPKTASVNADAQVDTVGLWWAEVLIAGDLDMIGNAVVKISSPLLPGGSVTISVPAGTGPLNLGDAGVVVGSTTPAPLVIQGPVGPTGPAADLTVALALAIAL
jgi:hypothetical protein